MQVKLAVVFAFCLGAGLAAAVVPSPRAPISQDAMIVPQESAAGFQGLQDATIADGDAHKVVLENEHIRVWECRATPGWKSPMHKHPPMVVVLLGSARQKVRTPDGQTHIVDLRPGTAVWQDKALEHSWELLAGDLHVIGVEVKSAQAPKGK